MPKMLRADQRCRRCGGTLELPHHSDTDCREALSNELHALLTRAREVSTSMWKLARVERRGLTKVGPRVAGQARRES
jgi:hypothetical protein